MYLLKFILHNKHIFICYTRQYREKAKLFYYILTNIICVLHILCIYLQPEKSSNIETNQNSNEQLFQKTNFLCGNMLWDRCVGICK